MIDKNKGELSINEKQTAEKLVYGQTLYHLFHRNADGTPQRWRVNGKCKTWKRNPERFQVPLKHGLYNYDYLNEDTANQLCLGMLQQVCMVCKRTIGWKDAERYNECDEVSHTSCFECGQKILAEDN